MPHNLTTTIVHDKNQTEQSEMDDNELDKILKNSTLLAKFNANLTSKSEDIAEEIVKEMMQRSVAIGQERH